MMAVQKSICILVIGGLVMSNKRRWLWGLVIIAVVATAWFRGNVYSDPDFTTTTRAVFVTGGVDSYWMLTVEGAKAAAETYGVDLQIEAPEQTEGIEQQITILIDLQKKAALQEFNGVAISPLDDERQTPIINQLKNNVHVVTFDSDAPLSERDYYVGASNYSAGQHCASLVRETLPEGGKIVLLASNQTKRNMKDRKAGIEEVLARYSDVEIVGFLSDNGSRDQCVENLRQAMTDHDDLAGVVGVNGYHGPIVLEFLKQEGQLGKLKLVMFDTADETLEGIAEGHIHGAIAQDPFKYGYEAIRMIDVLNRGRGEELPITGRGTIHVPCEELRADNIEEFRARIRE